MFSPSSPTSSGLNIAQQEAVNYMHGPCLVLAGAGSGKTRVITHKIGRLIQTGLEPKRIFAITFTNKAASEMRERAKSLIGKAAKDVVICTFHALGVRMMRQDGEALGLKPTFSILDTDDVTSILKDAGGSTDAATARTWQWTISRWKNMGLNAVQAEAQAKDDSEKITARIMARYEERLTAYQSVDFDDLISLPLNLLHNYEHVRKKWQALAGHVLVDEYQDTNATQYDFLKLLAGGNAAKGARFTVVGDDDQSIYGWRGATLDNLKKLPLDFPTLKVIKLEQNYRSTGAILRAANNVIGPNPKLFPKNLWSDLGEGEPVRVVDADSEEHEAERTVARIQSLRGGSVATATAGTGTDTAAAPGRPKQGTAPPGLSAAAPILPAQDGTARRALASGIGLSSVVREATSVGATGFTQYKEFKDFAVLYRANHQAKTFEKALRKAQIPYKVSGGTSFFDRAEIKDLCGWFRLWINNNDDPAFLRAITTPKRGIGHQTLGTLGGFAGRYKVSLFEALFSSSLGSVLAAKAVGSLHEFGRYVNDLEFRARHTVGAEAAKTFLLEWLKEIGYEKHLYDGEESEKLAAARWSNVMDFCDWMSARCGGQIDDAAGVSTVNEVKSLLDVAQTVSLLSTISERETDQNVVTLSTLHAAKGLEWPHVMLVGVTEGMLPFKLGDDVNPTGKSDGPMSEGIIERLQEERRLMYVGITRAQRSLAVSWTRKRKKGREMVAALPSRFIAEMGLDKTTVREDPREKLKALRAEFAKKALDAQQATALEKTP